MHTFFFVHGQSIHDTWLYMSSFFCLRDLDKYRALPSGISRPVTPRIFKACLPWIPGSTSPNFPYLTYYIQAPGKDERENWEDHCAIAAKVYFIAPSSSAPNVSWRSQDRRRTVLRGPTTNKSRRSPLCQTGKLGCRSRYLIQCRSIVAEGRPGWQWRWPWSIPDRCIQTSGAEPGFKQQRQAINVATTVRQRGTYEEEVHNRNDNVQ
jgi:hypothetical protein